MGTAAAYTFSVQPQYRAQAEFYISTVSAENPADLAQGSNFTQRQVSTYAEIVTTPYVLDAVIDDLDLDTTWQQLATQVTATAPASTVLIELSVVDPDPEQALEIARVISDEVVAAVSDLDKVEDTASPVRATVVSPASVGSSPVTPQPLRNLLLAAVLGLLVGAAGAVLRELTDTSVRREEDVREVTEAPILGGISDDGAAAKTPSIVIDQPHHPHSENFSALRTNLQFVNAGSPPKSMVLTSSLPGEGKTTTTAHLALTLASNGRKVCVVEADLRRPRLLEYLGMEGAAGLTNVLIGEATLDDMLQPFGDTTLTVLGAGPIPPNPAEILGTERMKQVIHDLEERFDTVLIDAPPLLPVTDAALLANLTDGALIVVGARIIKKDDLSRALSRLDKAQGNVLGLIVNRLSPKGVDGYYSYSADYAPTKAS